MTKKLADLLNIAPADDITAIQNITELAPVQASVIPDQAAHLVNLQDQLAKFDKISAALPMVDGLAQAADIELDTIAQKAEKAFDDLMDLGMNVDARYSTRMFEVAGTMINAAISAKSTKIDKKLKMVELQLKKLNIDKKYSKVNEDEIEAEGSIITDRNSMLERIKNMRSN